MPEATTLDATQTANASANTTSTEPTSLGWRAGLPDPLKTNPDLATFKTVGDFATHALEVQGKVKDLETKLSESIPKLPDNATDEDRATYYDALGRPKQASEYEFDGEDKNAPEWTNHWKGEFHKLGLTKPQAKQLSTSFNAQIQSMVKAHNDALAADGARIESEIKSQWGDKYDTNVELAKRMWSKHGEGDFDKAFANAPPAIRSANIKMLVKFASLTGEDTSPQSGHSATSKTLDSKEGWMNMYQNPVGGKK